MWSDSVATFASHITSNIAATNNKDVIKKAHSKAGKSIRTLIKPPDWLFLRFFNMHSVI